jgi:hypothetical protein
LLPGTGKVHVSSLTLNPTDLFQPYCSHAPRKARKVVLQILKIFLSVSKLSFNQNLKVWKTWMLAGRTYGRNALQTFINALFVEGFYFLSPVYTCEDIYF